MTATEQWIGNCKECGTPYRTHPPEDLVAPLELKCNRPGCAGSVAMNPIEEATPKPRRSKPNDQWTDYDPPWVEEIPGEPFRYRVESQSGPGFHTVDLTERNGHGRCSCKHFECVANPNFKRHGLFIPFLPGRNGVSECRHIRAAFDHYHLHVTQPLLAGFKAGVPKP